MQKEEKESSESQQILFLKATEPGTHVNPQICIYIWLTNSLTKEVCACVVCFKRDKQMSVLSVLLKVKLA